MTMPVKAMRLYADAAGQSRFEDCEIPRRFEAYAPPAAPLLVTGDLQASGFAMVQLPVGWEGTQHRSPRRHVLFGLSGSIRITPGEGEPRTVGAGDVVFLDDTEGSGHRTEVISGIPFDGVVVYMPQNG